MKKTLTRTATKTVSGTKIAVATAVAALAAGTAFLVSPPPPAPYGGCVDKDVTTSTTYEVAQLFKKSITAYNSGSKEDYCYTFPTTGKTYLMEGVCGSTGNFLTWQKNCAELNATKTGANYQCVSGACVDTAGTPVVAGKLEVSLAATSPASKLVKAGTVINLAAFNFKASAANVEVQEIALVPNSNSAVSSYKDYDELWFETESGQEISNTRMTPTSTKIFIHFDPLQPFIVKTSDTAGKVLILKAKLAAISMGYNGVSGHRIGLKIAFPFDIKARGAGVTPAVISFGNPAPTSNISYVYKAYPMFWKEWVSSKLANGTRDLYKFKISAVNGDVALGGFTFEVYPTIATIVTSSLFVYDVTNYDVITGNEAQINKTGGSVGASPNNSWQTVGWNNDWAGGKEVFVSQTQPRIFVVRGNIKGATTGASISTGLAGDAAGLEGASVKMLSAQNVDTQVHDDFIWSDLSADSHSAASADWTNGYLVPGLNPSVGTLETIVY